MGDQVRRILGKEGSQTCIYRSIGRQRMAMATSQPISCKGWGTWPDLVKKQPSTQDDYRFQNHLDTVRQPYVSHETGQWCAFPNFNEIRKYTGVNKAKNFEIFKDILADNHMSDQAHLFMMASGKLQALCYKYEIEKTLRTPDYAGFQLLALNDYSGQGTALVGVLDVFFEEKRIYQLCRMETFLLTYSSTDAYR